MLPAVSKKIDASAESSSSKKKEKKSKKSKKSSKKHKKEKKKSKKKKRSTSSDSDGSSAEERISKKKHKRKHFSDASSDSSSSESDEEDAWVEKGSENKNQVEIETKKKPEQAPTTSQREDWLGGLSSIRTFSKSAVQDEQPKKDERKGIDAYEPGKSVRELNPYWRDGGDGLPKAFAKPNYDSDSNDEDSRRSYRAKQNESARSSNWKKRSEPQQSNPATATRIASSKAGNSRQRSSSPSSSSSRSPTPERKPPEQSTSQASRDDFLTDQQMNELGAKLVKAEIMGNDGLAQELKDKLDRARKFRSEHKSEVLAKSFERRTQGATQKKREKEENVVLTTTNSKGQSRPVASFRDDSDLWGGRAGRKAKKQKVKTHLDGERVRYFADDDKYDIKRMVSFSINQRHHHSPINLTKPSLFPV